MIDTHLDNALRALTARVIQLELKDARNKPAGGISYNDSGGNFGGGFPNLQDILDAIGAGTLPTSFLTVIGGGKGTVQDVGAMGATETFDLANANYFAGTLDADCTITTTGWTNGKDCQILLELTEDGTGDWLPTISGVTWKGDAPAAAAAGEVIHIALFSRDGGTTIWGAVLGGGGLGGFPVCATDPVIGDTLIFDGAQWCPSALTPSDTYLTKADGEGHTVQDHGTVGAAETIDPALANWHLLTLSTNCTISLASPAAGPGCLLQLFIVSDGSSTITWPATVIWPGGVAPTLTTTAGNIDTITLATYDGGTNWYGSYDAGGGGDPATTVESETTFGITPAVGTDTEYARGDHTHGTPTTDAVRDVGRWELAVVPGSPPDALYADGDYLYIWVT